MTSADEPSNPHDALFKWAFAAPEHAQGELRYVLPPAVADKVDWNTLERQPGSFVDETLGDRHADLLFSVALSGRPAWIYVLLEHQSQPHPLMPFRLLRYMVRIWEQWLAAHKKAKMLPPIVPVVLHHGERGWSAATGMHEILDVEPAVLEALAEHVPSFQILLDDLSRQDSEQLHTRSMSALGKLALLCLARARSGEELLEALHAWAAVVREVLEAPDGVAALAALVRYILQVSEVPPDDLRGFLTKQIGPGAEEAYMTGAEMLTREVRERALAQGERRGELRGERRGERRGHLRGRRDLVRLQLEHKFGELSEGDRERIERAEPPQLDRWAARLLSADELEDVFER